MHEGMDTSTPLITPNLLATSVFHRPANPARTNSQQAPVSGIRTTSTTVANLGGNSEQLSSTRTLGATVAPSSSLTTPAARPALLSSSSSSTPSTVAANVKIEPLECTIGSAAMTIDPSGPFSSSTGAIDGSSRGQQQRLATNLPTPSSSASTNGGQSRVSPPPLPSASSSSRRPESHWDRSERESRSRDVREVHPPPSNSGSHRVSRTDSYRRQGDSSSSATSMAPAPHYRRERDDYRHSATSSSRDYGSSRTVDAGGSHYHSHRSNGAQPRDPRRVQHASQQPPPPSSSSSHVEFTSDHGSHGRSDMRKRHYTSDHSMSETEKSTPRSSGTADLGRGGKGRGGVSSSAGRGELERRREAKKARRDRAATTLVDSPTHSPKNHPNHTASDLMTTSDDSSSSDSDSDLNSGAGTDNVVSDLDGQHGMPATMQQQVRSVEAVRLQGIIHDLRMQLEKTYSKHKKYEQKAAQAMKRIQMLSGRLEKTFRQLSSINLEQEQRIAETMRQQQEQLLHLQKREAELEAALAAAAAATAAATAATSTTISNHPTRPAVGDKRVGAIVDEMEEDVELDSGQTGTAHFVTARMDDLHLSSESPNTARRRSIAGGASSSSSLAAQANANLAHRSNDWNAASQTGRFTLSSKSVVDTLSHLKVDLRTKAFNRKPRSLLMYSQLSGDKLKDIMVTSSLDGNIQFWDLISRRMIHQVYKNQLHFPWAEDVCWVGENLLAVASASTSGQSAAAAGTHGQVHNRQLALVHVSASPATSSSGLGSGRNGKTTVSTVCQHIDAAPHDKNGINVLAPVDQFTDGSLILATGGSDKLVYQWRFDAPNSDGDYVAMEPQLLHSRHTAAVQGLCYSRFDNVMFSGGTDCRLVGWDMEHQSTKVDHRYTDRGRITHIVQNPHDPRLLLVSHADKSNQLRLLDTRKSLQDHVLTLGFSASENISRYVAPSWHPSGGLISCGTTNGAGKIHLWDIRWKNVERGPGQSIDVHDKTIFRAAFHPTRSLMASMSSDASLAFIDFQFNPETVVHNS